MKAGARIPTSTAILAFEEFTFTYPRASRPALDDVSLLVGQGEFVVVAGRSGSGKSSLLRAASGLIPHFHGGTVSGRVLVAGASTDSRGPAELAEEVGYLGQDPEGQVVSTTVSAEIELPLRFRGDDPGDRARAIEEISLTMGIPHLLDRQVSTLSGGELQRVALAAALATRPGLILLDEPTSQLDPVAAEDLIRSLRQLNEEWGVAVLVAEHRLERLLPAADRAVVMERGAIAFDGSPAGMAEYALARDPALATPAARMFHAAGTGALPVGVREARAALTELLPEGPTGSVTGADPPMPPGNGRALRCRGLWVELDDGIRTVEALRGVDLDLDPGERVALMGRNGAGKSTLLRAAAGVLEPAAGGISARGGVALLTQSPSDYLVRESARAELPGTEGEAAMAATGFDGDPDADPRDLSGGQRQRLALAIALAGRMEADHLPDLVALDEPTRGMDRHLRDRLASLVDELAGRGAAVVIATHDVEFAASFADRVVLLGRGEVIADGPAASILSGGWHFTTEVARILGVPGVVGVEEGTAILTRGRGVEGSP